MSKKAIVSMHEILPHGYLLTGSRHALDQGENNVEGSTYNFLASILFTAFALEAYLNAVGVEKMANWEEMERYKVKKKLKLLCKKEDYELNLRKSPFDSFHEIFDFRNNIAHSKKPKNITDKIVFLDDRGLPKLSKWMEKANLQNAKKYLDDANKMIEILHHELKVEGFIAFSPGSASWRIVDADSNNE